MLNLKFKPNAKYDLIRLGKENDGGYLVEKNSLLTTKTLLSFGINDDWSFEKSFLKINHSKLLALDYSVSGKIFLKSFLENLTNSFFLLLWNPIKHFQTLYKSLYTLIDFIIFFKKERTFFQKMIGGPSNQSLNLSGVIKMMDCQDPIFIKCDIEGSEYRLLDELKFISKRLSGLVIEFHDVDLNKDKIVKFIEEFSLELVHTHPNNCGGYDEMGDPLVLELSFSKNPTKLEGKIKIPNSADMPNDPNIDDIDLIFTDV